MNTVHYCYHGNDASDDGQSYGSTTTVKTKASSSWTGKRPSSPAASMRQESSQRLTEIMIDSFVGIFIKYKFDGSVYWYWWNTIISLGKTGR